MDNVKRFSVMALAAMVLSTAGFAQDKKEKTGKEDKSEEIIIRKKGGKAEKMTIVVEGDNVTINGKPVDEFQNKDVTILRRDGYGPDAVPHIRRLERPFPAHGPQGFDVLMPAHGNRAMLGILTEKAEDGVKIKDITKESGAEKSGLQKDDVITKVGSKEVEDPRDLVEAIGEYKPNDKVDVVYKRNGKENKTSVTLGENKAPLAINFDRDHFNFNELDNFRYNFNHKPKIGLQIQDVEEGKGVTVKDVDEDSPAAKAGLKEGDIITQVNGKAIEGVDDLRTEIKDVKEGETIKLNYKRDGKDEAIEIKIPKRLKSADL